MVDVLFGASEPRFTESGAMDCHAVAVQAFRDDLRAVHWQCVMQRTRGAQEPPAWSPLNSDLNESQLNAVEFALRAQDVAVVHGPPGN